MAEVNRVLARPPGGDPRDRPAVDTGRAEGVLRLTAARNELLQHHLVTRDEAARLVVAPEQLRARADRPRLVVCEAVQLLLQRGLEDQREAQLRCLELVPARWMERPRMRNAHAVRQLIREALVVRPPEGRPVRRRQLEPLGQRGVIPCDEGGRLVTRGVQRPTVGALVLGQGQQVGGAVAFTRPVETPRRVARPACHEVIALADDPDRDPAATQTSGNAEAAGVPADYDRAVHAVIVAVIAVAEASGRRRSAP